MNMRTLLWVACLIAVIIPSWMLWARPNLYDHPVVAFLLSVAVAAISVVASRKQFFYDAEEKAKTEWLSQAESACDRLITTASQVKRLKMRTLRTCDDAVENLPELQDDRLKAVRTLLRSNCAFTGEQLHDIEQHLEGAFADWRRFIRKNCEGDDCRQIENVLAKRRLELLKPMGPSDDGKCGSQDGAGGE